MEQDKVAYIMYSQLFFLLIYCIVGTEKNSQFNMEQEITIFKCICIVILHVCIITSYYYLYVVEKRHYLQSSVPYYVFFTYSTYVLCFLNSIGYFLSNNTIHKNISIFEDILILDKLLFTTIFLLLQLLYLYTDFILYVTKQLHKKT